MDGSILVMDYSKVEREKIKHILSRLGNFNIIEAAGFNQYELLSGSEDNILLVVMDLEFPSVKEGFEILEDLKRKTGKSDIPVIIVTKQDKLEYRKEAAKYGAKDYIIKPYPVKRLEGSLKSVVKVQKEFLYPTQGMENIHLTFDEFINKELKFALRMQFPLSIILITSNRLSSEDAAALPSPDEMKKIYSIICKNIGQITRISDHTVLNNQKDILVVLRGSGSKEAGIVFERIKAYLTDALQQMRLEYDDLFFSVCVTFPEDGEDFQGLMQSAFKRIADKEMLEKIASIPVNMRRYANRRYHQFNRWF